jgi:transposase
MWTEQHRKIYQRVERRYPSDMTDGEWVRLEPLIPPAKPGGRLRETNMREAINAILYLLRTGCPWCYLPREGFPPRSTPRNIRARTGDAKLTCTCGGPAGRLHDWRHHLKAHFRVLTSPQGSDAGS